MKLLARKKARQNMNNRLKKLHRNLLKKRNEKAENQGERVRYQAILLF